MEMDQISAVGMMKKIVPITGFNNGKASKILDEDTQVQTVSDLVWRKTA